MQSSFDPRGLFRCYNRVVMIKPSPKPWGCWHAVWVTSVSLSPHSPQLLDSRRGVEGVASSPEVCRGCGDVSLTHCQSSLWPHRNFYPRGKVWYWPQVSWHWDTSLAAPTLSTSAAVGAAPSYPPKQITALRIQESSQRSSKEQHAKMIPSGFLSISLCK